jgi:aspartate/methionine/tyrosine aminotransferase
VLEIAREFELFVVCDEINAELAHSPDKFVSAAVLDPDNVVVTGGLSKSHALGGWRVGVLRAPATEFGHRLASASNQSLAKSGRVCRHRSTPRPPSPTTSQTHWSNTSHRHECYTRPSAEPRTRSSQMRASPAAHRQPRSTSIPISRRCANDLPSGG